MVEGATRYRADYEQHGFSGTHKQVIAWVPRGSRVLELGCSSGYVGRVLIEEKGCEVTGVEPDPEAAREAEANGLHVLCGSIDDPSLRARVEGTFDVVIAADVLEHLPDPALTLEQMKRWLRPSGVAIVAVPNIATWSIRWQLFMRGDFEYQETGIMDRTHLHFFTWLTLNKLLEAQGWTTHERMIEGIDIPLGQTWLFDRPRAWLGFLDSDAGKRWRAPALLKKGTATVSRFVIDRAIELGARLADAFPNLCAPHVALLISPPQGPA